MHYDSKHNTKKRSADVDLFDRETRFQRPADAQVSGAFPEMLSGRDPLRVMRAGVANGGHDWLPYGWARK